MNGRGQFPQGLSCEWVKSDNGSHSALCISLTFLWLDVIGVVRRVDGVTAADAEAPRRYLTITVTQVKGVTYRFPVILNQIKPECSFSKPVSLKSTHFLYDHLWSYGEAGKCSEASQRVW